MALVGFLLTLVWAYFAQQNRVTREVQARNELNIQVRALAESVSMDLQMAGARAVVDIDGKAAYVPAVVDDDACSADFSGCVVVVPFEENDGVYELSIVYATSLRATNSCRRIVYHFDPEEEVIYRADDPCEATTPTLDSFATRFLTGVLNLNVTFVCTPASEDEDAIEAIDPADCFVDGYTAIRQAVVLVSGESRGRTNVSQSLELTTTMPNTRSLE